MEAQAAERDTLTHGFHAYAARMHPAIAGVLLDELSPAPGATVLDPFCGSGTVLVEAMVAGWRSHGSDLNPLALRLARVKTQRRKAGERKRFLELVRRTAAASEARVRDRVPIHVPLPREEVEWYDPHVLKELGGLMVEIRRVKGEQDRLALEMIFSSIVVKVSRQRADTQEKKADKKIRKGLATEFFARKGKELVRRWEELDQELPGKVHRPKIVQADATNLGHTLGPEFRCDLILSSPPYGGTYDYVDHHARRYPWLGISPKAIEQGEIGARRELSGDDGHPARERWDEQVRATLRSMRGVLRRDGLAVLLMGDGEVAGERVAADQQLERIGAQVGLEVVAVASQPRPDWKGGEVREEHLVALLAV